MPNPFLANGNGTLNAFAAQATGHDYVVLSNELFVNLYNSNRDGLRFILGHELGAHPAAPRVAVVPDLGGLLAADPAARLLPVPPARVFLRPARRLPGPARGDRSGPARLGPVHRDRRVNVDELVRQGRTLRGFWVGLAQLPRSHPFTVRRLERLYRVGLFHSRAPDAATRA